MNRMTRREILRFGTLAGITAAGVPILGACAAPSAPGAPSVPTASAAATAAAPAAKANAVVQAPPVGVTGKLACMTWNSATDQRQACINEFMKQYPGVGVELISYPPATWDKQLTATFVSGTPVVDAGIIKEELLGSWISAGFVSPLDGLPGLDEIKSAMYPGVLADCTYNGKIYGLPYYTNYFTWVSNKKILSAAGIAAPPKTWDELKTQAQQIKQAGVLSGPPLIFGFKPGATLWFDWWTLVYASGGNLFDQNDDPVFDGQDPIPLEILNRIVDLSQSGLVDPKSTELEIPEILNSIKAGQVAMTTTLILYALDLSDPNTSKVVGDWQFSAVPSLNGTMKNTAGFTRQYILGAKTTQRDAAWQFLRFMAGKDSTGAYYAPTSLLTSANLLSGLSPVMESAPVQTYLKQLYPNLDLFYAQQQLEKPRQALKATWYPQWDAFNQQTLQDVVSGKLRPSDGLKASANKARDLKKSG
jgi:multiple sugar transport system substrate-binding protein